MSVIPDEILHAARMTEAEFNTLILTSRNSANDHWHRQAQGMQARRIASARASLPLSAAPEA